MGGLDPPRQSADADSAASVWRYRADACPDPPMLTNYAIGWQAI